MILPEISEYNMKCPNCNKELSFKTKRCDNCGHDLELTRKLFSYSNICYNDGLERAKIRDLTGAALILRKSLKYYKGNIQARNLLGLVLYEQGEVVQALSEWVISKNLQEENNIADYYINKIQSNPAKLEVTSQMVKKYNSSLASAKKGDEDMAIIQLRKVVSSYPKFIKAGLLLALLYLKSGKKENRIKAYRVLKSILKIDVTNPTALKYIKELPEIHDKNQSGNTAVNKNDSPTKVLPKIDPDAYRQITPYKEEKPAILPFINVIGGIILGLIIMAFVIEPAIQRYNNKADNSTFKKYSEDLATSDSSLTALQEENDTLKETNEELQKKVADLQGGDPTDIANYKEMYESLIDAMQLYTDGKKTEAAEKLLNVEVDSLDSDVSKKYYNTLKKQTFEFASNEYFEKGRDAYNGQGDYSGKKNYDKAIKFLEKSLEFNVDNTDSMYFLGRCYQQKSDTDKAKEYYNKIVDNYPDSARESEAQSRLREMGE